MELKMLAARLVGLLFLAVASISLLASAFFVILPSEISSLHATVDKEVPPKLVAVADSYIPAELKGITIEDLRTGCFAASQLGSLMQYLKVNLPMDFQSKEVQLLCSEAENSQSMDELKLRLVTREFEPISAGMFTKIDSTVVAPTQAYLPYAIVGFLVCYGLFAALSYFGSKGIVGWIGNILGPSSISGLVVLIALVAVYLLCPSYMENIVKEELAPLLSLIPSELSQVAEGIQTDLTNMAVDWLRVIIAKLMLIYGLVSLLCGAGWLGCKVVEGMSGKKKTKEGTS